MIGRRLIFSIMFLPFACEILIRFLIFFNVSKNNRVLLRVRMLYYIKHEVVGDLVPKILEGVPIE